MAHTLLVVTSSPRKKLVLAGGSGLIGTALTAALPRAEWEVVVLTRSLGQPDGRPEGDRSEDASAAVREVGWDGRSQGAWAGELDGADALVNLAGKNIDCRPTQANRQALLRSRVDTTRALGQAVLDADQPPAVWINASAMAYYGDVGARECLEQSPPGRGFLAELCQAWEAAQTSFETPGTRQVRMRIAIVLARQGGALPRLKKLAHFALGGTVGSGKQVVSWIHLDDIVGVIRFLLEAERAEGAYNVAAPGAVPNREFQRTLRRVLGEWVGLWAPAPMVKLGAWLMGSNGQLALMGARIVPKRLEAAGFDFAHPELEGALRDLLDEPAPAAAEAPVKR